METHGRSSKRKRTPGFESNLERFKSDVKQLHKDNEIIRPLPDSRDFKKKVGLTRKERRKEDRKLKKMKINAFKRHLPMPSKDTLEAERTAKQKAEKRRLKQQEKRKRRKLRKYEDRRKIREEEQLRVQGLAEANKKEDKIIKELEKQLFLKKRKSKKLPQGFINDGLDYLLEIVDPEKLKTIFEQGDDVPASTALASDEEMSDADQPASEDGLDLEESEGEDSDLEMEDKDFGVENDDSDGDEDEDSGGSENEENIESDDENDSDINYDGDNTEDKYEIGKYSKSKSKSDVSQNKCVTFQEPAAKKAKKSMVANSGAGNVENALETESSNIGSDNSDTGSDNSYSESDMDNSNNGSDGSDIGSDIDNGSDIGDLENIEDSENSDIARTQKHKKLKKDNLKEDIYGRLRDKEGNIIDKEASKHTGYIPPAKRLAMASSDEKKKFELERLKKQLKGLLNRLSEANMQSVSNQVEEMFRQHSRGYLCEILTALMLEACVTPELVPERLLMEQVLLLSILHVNVGTEVGAMFLQAAVNKFHQLLDVPSYSSGKEMNNIVLILSNLYNFKVIQSPLVFDILRKFVENFQEKDIELLLLILKNVGFTLRKDDPEVLKNLIVEIKEKAGSVDTSKFEDQSRVKFMLEVLMAIRNNNMRKIPNYDLTHMEHLRKLLRQYTTGGSSVDYQLRISLEDLLKSEEEGRWWLVGSAWAGKDVSRATGLSEEVEKATDVQGISQKILDLAAKQRMNTDVRRNIFCIIMTSEDYVDAFEKLLKLGLKMPPEKEIIHVIMDVCMQEAPYNPFYSYLSQKFCEYHRRFQMTVQFFTWDKLKVLHEVKDTHILNLARFLTHLIATKAMSLSIFKVVEFSELNKSVLLLMKTVLTLLLTEYEEYVSREAFMRIATLAKLRTLHEGLKLFMRHFILRQKGKDEQTMSLLKERVEVAERTLNAAESALKL